MGGNPISSGGSGGPVGASGGLISQMPQNPNPEASAFNSETEALQTQAKNTVETNEAKDHIIGKVLEYAGNGQVDEARFVAQQNGIQLPEQIYTNSKMAKLGSVAAQLYPDDPNKASAYMVAGMHLAASNPASTFLDWSKAGMASAGTPLTVNQREINKIQALADINSKIPLSTEKRSDANTANAGKFTDQQKANTEAGFGMGQQNPYLLPSGGQPSAGLTAPATDPTAPGIDANALPAGGSPAPVAPQQPTDNALPVDNTNIPPRATLVPDQTATPAAASATAPAAQPQPASARNTSDFGWGDAGYKNIYGMTPAERLSQQKESDKITSAHSTNNKIIANQLTLLDNLEGLAKSVPQGATAPYQVRGANLFNPSGDTATQGTDFAKQATQVVRSDLGYNYVPGQRGSNLMANLAISGKPEIGVPTATNLSTINGIRGKYLDSQISGEIDAQYRAANPYAHLSGPEVDQIDKALKKAYPITTQTAGKHTAYNAGNVAKIQALIPMVIKYGPDVLKNPEAYLKQSGFVPVANQDSGAGLDGKRPTITGPDDPVFGSLPPGATFIDGAKGSPTFGQIGTKQ